MTVRRPAPRTLSIVICTGLMLAAAFLYSWQAFARLPAPLIMTLLIATAGVFAAMSFLVLEHTRPRWSALSRRSRIAWLAGAVLAGWLLTWMIPLDPAPAPGKPFSVEISSLGTHSKASQGAEVWAKLVVDGRSVELGETDAGPTWITGHGYLITPINSPPDRIEWNGHYRRSVQLHLYTHPWSGKARVRWPGNERTFDLYSSVGGNVDLALAHGVTQTSTQFLLLPARTPLQYLVQACQATSLGLLILGGLALFSRWPLPTPAPNAVVNRSMTGEVLIAALPLIAVGSVLLVIFSPAILTTDSLGQWNQASTGRYSDAHPVMYAFYLWVIQRINGGPALAAWLQMAAMAMASGWLAVTVRRACNAPVWTSLAGGVLVAAYPLTALTSITLWKDVPYASSVTALTALVIGNLFLGVPDLRRFHNGLALAALAAACIGLRHNGPPVAAAAFLILLLRPGHRLHTVAYLVMAVALAWCVKGPLADAVGTERTSAAYMAYTHHLSAHLASGQRPESATDAAILDAIDKGADDWRYRCSVVNTTIFDTAYDIPTAVTHQDDLFRIWLRMALDRPDVELGHMLCASGMVWRYRTADDGPLYLYAFGFTDKGELGLQWVQPGLSGFVETSPFPSAAASIGRTMLDVRLKCFWRPAPFLCALAFLTVLAWSRTGDRRILLIPALVLVHTMVLMVAIIAQDARYQLPIYIVLLAVGPALALSRRGEITSPAEVARRDSA